jgi:hypothetical protein
MQVLHLNIAYSVLYAIFKVESVLILFTSDQLVTLKYVFKVNYNLCLVITYL